MHHHRRNSMQRGDSLDARPIVLASPRAMVWAALLIGFAVAENTRAVAGDAGLPVDSVVLRLLEEAEIPSQEAGLLAAVLVHEGQRVSRGDVLARLDDDIAKLAVGKAKIELGVAREKIRNDVRLRYARKALDVAEAELERSKESIRKFPKSVSQSQLDVEKLTVQKTTLEIEQAGHELSLDKLAYHLKETELNAARLQLQRRQIVAPIDGVVVQVHARVGEWVKPGDRVLRIVNTDRLKAEGFLREVDADPRLVGSKVLVRTSGTRSAHQEIAGRLVFVSPETDPINQQVRVWAEVDNSNQDLRPGQRATLRIVNPPSNTSRQAAR